MKRLLVCVSVLSFVVVFCASAVAPDNAPAGTIKASVEGTCSVKGETKILKVKEAKDEKGVVIAELKDKELTIEKAPKSCAGGDVKVTGQVDKAKLTIKIEKAEKCAAGKDTCCAAGKKGEKATCPAAEKKEEKK